MSCTTLSSFNRYTVKKFKETAPELTLFHPNHFDPNKMKVAIETKAANQIKKIKEK